jgi:hypothetical protein
MLIHCCRDIFTTPLHSNEHDTDHRKHHSSIVARIYFHRKVFTEPLPRNELFQLSGIMSQYNLEYGSVGLIWFLQKTDKQLGTFLFEEFYFPLPDMPCNICICHSKLCIIHNINLRFVHCYRIVPYFLALPLT